MHVTCSIRRCSPPAPRGRAQVVAVALEAVLARRFGAEYQPIVEVRGGKLVAHEALARFFDPTGAPVAPLPIFAELRRRRGLLLRVELELKRFQIRHAPAGPLFLNVDASGFAEARRGRRNALLEILRRAGSARLVVEAVESRSRDDLRLEQEMLAGLRAAGLSVALDDVGAPDALLSLDSLRRADVVKLDRTWLAGTAGGSRLAALEALVRLARQLGKRTVLEGVECDRDLALARDLGVDWAQGFLFRDRFHCARADPLRPMRAA